MAPKKSKKDKWMKKNKIAEKQEAADRVARALVDDSMLQYLNELGTDRYDIVDIGIVVGAVMDRFGKYIRFVGVGEGMQSDDVPWD